jgi:hypothetical protein
MTVSTLNTGATWVKIINPRITNIMMRLFQAAIGDSLSALSLTLLSASFFAAKASSISF